MLSRAGEAPSVMMSVAGKCGYLREYERLPRISRMAGTCQFLVRWKFMSDCLAEASARHNITIRGSVEQCFVGGMLWRSLVCPYERCCRGVELWRSSTGDSNAELALRKRNKFAVDSHCLHAGAKKQGGRFRT